MHSTPDQRRAVAELVFAGVLWGFGFVAAVWALRVGGALTITGWRFLVAGVMGLLVLHKGLAQPEIRLTMKAAAWPGFFIASTLILQTWGLQFTTATKSGFITCLYVLMVPLLEPWFGGPKPTRKVLVCGAFAVFGLALMCGLLEKTELNDRTRLNWGDALTLLCALMASAHILVVGRISGKLGPRFHSLHFNTMQSLWAGIPTLLLALLFEPGALRFPIAIFDTPMPMLGFVSLSLGSTFIAFALQIRAQKVIKSSTAAILFLLESPFAAIFAYFLLGETLSPLQLSGGVIILVAIAISSKR